MAYQKIEGISKGKTERGDCKERWDLIKKELPESGVVLDIGCAEGYFLKQIADTTNLLAVGIEKNLPRVEYQKNWLTDKYIGKVVSCHGSIGSKTVERIADTCEYINVTLALSVLHWINNDSFIKNLATISGKLIVEIPKLDDLNATGQKFMNRVREYGSEKKYFEEITGRTVRFLGEVKAHTSTTRNLWVIEGDTERKPIIPHINYNGTKAHYTLNLNNNKLTFIKKGIVYPWIHGVNLATLEKLCIVFPKTNWWKEETEKSINMLDKSKVKGDLRIHNLIISRDKFNWIDLDHHGHKPTIMKDIKKIADNNMNILEFEYHGEFGWEIASIIPGLRKQSKEYDKTIVHSFKEMEYLYKDFAEFIPHSGTNRSCDFDRKVYKVRGDFKKYGTPLKEYDILIHARGIKRKSNYNYKKWNDIVTNLKGYKIACIGSLEDKNIEGTVDERNISMERLTGLLSGAKVCIGVSSGILHLASHCGCPHIIWGDGKTRFGRTLGERYKTDWNPFNTPIKYITNDKFQPEPEKILEEIFKVLGDRVFIKNTDKKINKIILLNGNLLGDTLALTAGVRDIKKQYPEYDISVATKYPMIWKNNPYITNNYMYEKPKSIKDKIEKDREIYEVGLRIVTYGSKSNQLHITNGLRLCMKEKIGLSIKQGLCIPEIFLSDREKTNRVVKQKYWIISTGYSTRKHKTKDWNTHKWQEVVDKCPDITFVQTGLRTVTNIRLQGSNVIDYVGKTDNLRDLFSLFYHAEGAVCLIGGNAHIAGALRKPCVVIAGANEPITFEAYTFHRYLSNIGSLPCTERNGCFRCGLCDNSVNGVAKCKDMISSNDVVNAINSYYTGGVLKKETVCISTKKKIKVVCNAHSFGGAEKSTIEIIKMFNNKDYNIDLISRNRPCREFLDKVPFVNVTKDITGDCDILLLYASDMVFDFHKEEFKIFEKVKAKRKVMALTYKLGKAGKVSCSKGWDLYMFLCSSLRDSFLTNYSEGKTEILAPPVDLDKFLKIQPDYDSPLHIVRHSSQGDRKFPTEINEMIETSNAKFSMMPSPSFITKRNNVITYSYNELPVDKFLSSGNCFWYPLPYGYTDQGSRVLVEAMASGLSILADNRDGAKDRVTDETGWLIDKHEDYIPIINSLTNQICRSKGMKARERAIKEFKKENWIKHIEGVKE